MRCRAPQAPSCQEGPKGTPLMHLPSALKRGVLQGIDAGMPSQHGALRRHHLVALSRSGCQEKRDTRDVPSARHRRAGTGCRIGVSVRHSPTGTPYRLAALARP